MLLEFTNKNINAYANGELKFFNDGKPFPVTNQVAELLLTAEIMLDGAMVKVFQAVKAESDTEAKTEVPKEIKVKKEKE